MNPRKSKHFKWNDKNSFILLRSPLSFARFKNSLVRISVPDLHLFVCYLFPWMTFAAWNRDYSHSRAVNQIDRHSFLCLSAPSLISVSFLPRPIYQHSIWIQNWIELNWKVRCNRVFNQNASEWIYHRSMSAKITFVSTTNGHQQSAL